MTAITAAVIVALGLLALAAAAVWVGCRLSDKEHVAEEQARVVSAAVMRAISTSLSSLGSRAWTPAEVAARASGYVELARALPASVSATQPRARSPWPRSPRSPPRPWP